MQEVQREAMATAMPSHNHPEGLIGAMAVGEAIWLMQNHHAANSSIKDEWLISIASLYYGEDCWDENTISPKGAFDETCRGCVPLALFIVYNSNSFEDAIRNAVLYGGDSDTLAAIVGSIAEPLWGVPASLREEFTKYLPDEMIDVLTKFENKYGHD